MYVVIYVLLSTLNTQVHDKPAQVKVREEREERHDKLRANEKVTGRQGVSSGFRLSRVDELLAVSLR